MPEWMPLLLLFVFATHMPFFGWRYHRTREVRHAATALTFALLAVTYALRIFAPNLDGGELPLYVYVRVPAWISAVISMGMLLNHHISRARGTSRASTSSVSGEASSVNGSRIRKSRP